MRVVAMIPYWSGYKFPEDSIEQRDTVMLGGKALINYTIRIANQAELIDEVCIYASDNRVLASLEDRAKCEFRFRDSSLDGQGVPIESIIHSFFGASDADIVVMMHPRTPFLKASTVFTCINRVVKGQNDSAFVATWERKLAWFRGRRLNYSTETVTPSLSDIEPVLLECSSVYVVDRNSFEKSGRRIGNDPYIHQVGHFEGFEIDSLDDFKIAELLVNSGFGGNGA
jgi:CMP-N-acetylneuraminic acid synthetase